MLYLHDPVSPTPLRQAIVDAYQQNEDDVVNRLLNEAALSPAEEAQAMDSARALVEKIRARTKKAGGMDAILRQYDLSSQEGIALMCVAEALLRIPDARTVDRLLADKLSMAEWSTQSGKSPSMFANAVTWSLLLTGKLYSSVSAPDLSNAFSRWVQRSSGVAIRPAVRKFMALLGRKFVMGQTINEALRRATPAEARGYRYSYDMLGEAARTEKDALHYQNAYLAAIEAIGIYAAGKGPIAGPGISIKLSALYPRYELAHKVDVLRVMVPRVMALVSRAKHYNIGLTIDAEEADRLDIELDVVEAVFLDPSLGDWTGFGIAVQSYQKRAAFVLDFLADLCRRANRRMMVRLIKGAYWDYEIKVAQQKGLPDYPVFTRKHATDVSYIACAKRLLSYSDVLYPQFATHNAFSIAVVRTLAGDRPYEFQCLHGMGQKLYDHVVGGEEGLFCRVYAPVGSHKELLGYLMRRLLENGANTSFVNMLAKTDTPIDTLLENPITKMRALPSKRHPHIPLPSHIFNDRINSRGVDLTDMNTLRSLKTQMDAARAVTMHVVPKIHGETITGEKRDVLSPIDKTVCGYVTTGTAEHVNKAYAHAVSAHPRWSATSVDERAACLLRAADLLETHQATLMVLAVREAGKTVPNAIGEIREAVDFCRYYATLAKTALRTQRMPGPTGELNELSLHGRGVMVCISPWNFPLAIFLGQVVAALVAGNCVLAKSSEQTSLIAAYAVDLLYQAGIPTDVLQWIPGPGRVIGARMIDDARLAGVIFTGSTETARGINHVLAAREGAIVPFVAETGGQNCMIVDSSALPEQVVADVMMSAFDSAGQRCSALRVLFLQKDIADTVITMLVGAMHALKLGDPADLATDIGPVIDRVSQERLHAHIERMKREATLLYEVSTEKAPAGYFVGPCAFELPDLSGLTHEVFGPVLHIVRYDAKDIDNVIAMINNTGYGLTLGVHSRIQQFAAYIQARTHVGNLYVNRNMVGAVVGVQPFGGEGLSGTGPKAGGPHYLYRLCTERTLSVNTTAAGGNASLLTLTE